MNRRRKLRFLRRALEERIYLLKNPDVLGVAVGIRERKGQLTDELALIVYVKKGRKRKSKEKYPKHRQIPARVRIRVNREMVWLPVDLIEISRPKLHQSSPPIVDSSIFIPSGVSVGNRRSATNTGSIGWVARRQLDNVPVICGNWHIFLPFPKQSSSALLTFEDPDGTGEMYLTVPSRRDGGDPNQDVVAQVIRGRRSPLVDLAIAIATDDLGFAPIVPAIGTLGPVRSLRSDEIDAHNPILVCMRGRSSFATPAKPGRILRYPARVTFPFPDLPNGLLMLDLIETDIPTTFGDSGALLLDLNRRPLGMLIGGTGATSFFMHIRNVIGAMKLKDF